MRLLIFILIIICFESKAQSVNLTAGKSKYSPILQGEVELNLKGFILQGVLGSHLDREDPAFVGARFGYNFQMNQKNTLFLQPLMGYHLVWVNFHNTPNNHYAPGYGMALIYKHLKIEVYNIDKYEFVGIGIIGLKLN